MADNQNNAVRRKLINIPKRNVEPPAPAPAVTAEGMTDDEIIAELGRQLHVSVPEHSRNEYVDLGLPSGTLWARKDAPAAHWGAAASGKDLPSREQYEELLSACASRTLGRFTMFAGRNGECLVFRHDGWRTRKYKLKPEDDAKEYLTQQPQLTEPAGCAGYYRTSTPDPNYGHYVLKLDGTGESFIGVSDCFYLSVRKVKTGKGK